MALLDAVPELVDFPRTAAVLDAELSRQHSVGAALYVSLDGEVVCEVAVGTARPGKELTRDSLVAWMSCSKAICAVALGQQWEQGRLDVDDRVRDYVPEFARHDKGDIRIRHLLTHTAGIRTADVRLAGERFSNDFATNVAIICDSRPEPGWVPGKRAGYHVTSAMMMIAEIVRRVDGRPFDAYVREAIFVPLGMDDSWIGMPPEQYRAYGDRIALMHQRTKEGMEPGGLRESEEDLARVIPGGGGRGPLRDLGRLHEMLVAKGTGQGTTILRPTTVEALTARHRVGMHDQSFGQVLDWGLGFMLDTKHAHGGGEHLYGYGRHASPRTYGHPGYRSSTAFADPEAALVVALWFNGLARDDAEHTERQNAVARALYEDLRLEA